MQQLPWELISSTSAFQVWLTSDLRTMHVDHQICRTGFLKKRVWAGGACCSARPDLPPSSPKPVGSAHPSPCASRPGGPQGLGTAFLSFILLAVSTPRSSGTGARGCHTSSRKTQIEKKRPSSLQFRRVKDAELL